MSFRCPAGHTSDEPDYCSVCGVSMLGSAQKTPAVAAPSSSASTTATPMSCPVCGERRTDAAARFCEVCRYDFNSAAPRASNPPVSTAAPAPPTAGPRPSASGTPLPISAPRLQPAPPAQALIAPSPPFVPAVSGAPPRRWEVIVTIDPSLDTEPDAQLPPPADPPRVFPVELAEMLIGRRDDQQNVRPAIPLHDPGASRRHAKLLLNSDGTVSLLDLASTNGTRLNGHDVLSGSVCILDEGDAVTIGRWTRITLRGRA